MRPTTPLLSPDYLDLLVDLANLARLRTNRAWDDREKPFGQGELAVLRLIARHQGHISSKSVVSLVEERGMTMASASRMIEKLRRADLIEDDAAPCATYGRRDKLQLTAAGAAFIDEFDALWPEIEAEVFQGFEAADLTRLGIALRHLRSRIDDEFRRYARTG